MKDRLTDQGAARRDAEQLNRERTNNRQAVAVPYPVPFGSPRGTEKGWTVVYLAPSVLRGGN